MKGYKTLNENSLAWGFIAIYLVLSFVWHFSTDAPWDDDCISRYYNVKDAFKEPSAFINLWNRPLFVLVFAIPFQLSKHAILLMAFISASSQYALFEVAKKWKIKYAFMVVPFMAFQAFYFTISRSSLAEPLAAALIAWSLYFMLNKKLVWFAILGGLLPLARLELAPALLLWAVVLVQNKKWFHVLWLGVPTLLWNFGGTILEGDWLWLYHQTVGKEKGANSYGYTEFNHYFLRFIFIIGPVVFYFFIVGFIEGLLRKTANWFLYGGFSFVFSIYVLFSWKLSLGDAAGFLRHFITISPLMALIALKGMGYWMRTIEYWRWSFSGIKPKSKAIEQTGMRIMILGIVLSVIAYNYFSMKIKFHHVLSKDVDYTNLWILSALVIFPLIYGMITRYVTVLNSFKLGVSYVVAIGLMSFTLITEPPDKNNSHERKAISEVSDMYNASFLSEFKTYVNHGTFFWANDLEKNDDRFELITQENMAAAPDSSVIIWETHYNNHNKLKNLNVTLDYFKGKSDFVELFRVYSSKKSFVTVVLRKLKNQTAEQKLDMYNQLADAFPNVPSIYVNRANHKINKFKDFNNALPDYDKALSIDLDYFDAVFNRGIAYYNLKNYNEAAISFKHATKINEKHAESYYNWGACMSNQKDYKSAVKLFAEALKHKKSYDVAMLNKGLAHANLKEFKEAIANYNNYLKLKPKVAVAHQYRGIAYLNMNDRDHGCADLQLSQQLGNQAVANLINTYCR